MGAMGQYGQLGPSGNTTDDYTPAPADVLKTRTSVIGECSQKAIQSEMPGSEIKLAQIAGFGDVFVAGNSSGKLVAVAPRENFPFVQVGVGDANASESVLPLAGKAVSAPHVAGGTPENQKEAASVVNRVTKSLLVCTASLRP